MPRSYDFQSMVDLPKADAVSTAALIAAMLGVAARENKERRLAPNVAKARTRLDGKHEELNGALRDGLGPAIDAGSLSAADRTAASAWAGTELWVQGWRRIPAGEKHTRAAERIEERIFPDGLRFLRVNPARRWSESERRLAHIKEHEMEADFALLGGEAILATLRATHESFGAALGINAPRPVTEAPQVRERLDGAKAALRYYVFQVTAQVDPEDASTAEVAERLLEPLLSYDATPRARAVRPAPPPESSKAPVAPSP